MFGMSRTHKAYGCSVARVRPSDEDVATMLVVLLQASVKLNKRAK